jgi:hypothetical protein
MTKNNFIVTKWYTVVVPVPVLVRITEQHYIGSNGSVDIRQGDTEVIIPPAAEIETMVNDTPPEEWREIQ